MSDQHNRMQDRMADMMEATRLTASGRLGDASALVQRSLSEGTTEPHGGVAHTADAGLTDRLRKVVETVTQGLGRSVAPVLHGLGVQGLGGGVQEPGQRGLDVLGRQVAEPEPVRDADRFVERSFTGEHGTRDYKLFVPGSRARNRPLVVMLHGCSQSPDDFAAGTGMNALAEAHGFTVAYPGQSSRANGQRCWNWFQPGEQDREAGETGIIAGLTRAVIAEYGIDPRQVFIAGLSAGGAAAANVAHAYPELFAAVGIHSGLAAGCARDVSAALTVMRLGPVAEADCIVPVTPMPTIVFHGESDGTVNPRNGAQALAQAGIGGLTPETTEAVSAGGLPYLRTRYADTKGHVSVESWMVRGLGHAWSGGTPAGSYTDPRGPDASRAMLNFFLANPLKT
ncbi:PHB depolymerase family esterase [Methylobacterium sp. WL69]|uniref:extracellular catalytic domain type 1 short-chain-length polyhydroxyalkanoate depolymerase n=1 Tax=Methylobacterium sp. WL69 TaxID=2603893 RepID=UPI0011C8ABFB|nr:PHB depolymerase family esterase [Methylobacterium sp. WL69]TXM76195.1 PHB depolymerase family esterase [Methylobacterium sp. WL69]